MLLLLLACVKPAEVDRLHLEVALLEARVSALEAASAKPVRPAVDPEAQRRLDEQGVVGRAAPEIAVASWYQGKGAWSDAPVTLVLFFETWCPHCQNEMPHVEETFERWHPRGLGVIGFTRVTRSSTDDAVRAFLHDNHVSFPVAREAGGSMSTAFVVSGIPAAALVKDGLVVWRGHPAQLTDELLASYVGSAPGAGSGPP